jgi:hypothetical protein
VFSINEYIFSIEAIIGIDTQFMID